MKGFVYTLEAVIASTIILSMILVVIPQVTEDPEIDPDPVETGLKTLDQKGELSGSSENISNSIEDFVPANFNYSVMVVETEKTELEVTGDEEIELENGYKNVLIWVEEAENLRIAFKNDTVLQTNQEGYHEVELGGQPGYLNFTADNVALDAEINRYRSEGRFLGGNTVYIVNYIQIGQKMREIRVMLSE